MAVMEWGIVVVDGERPCARGGHTAATAENQIVVFGGSSYKEGGKFAYYNDVHVLDTETRFWYRVVCSGDEPLPRYGHSVELVGSRMFVFGGRGEFGVLRDTCFLDLVEWTWVNVAVTSACPAPRFNHASLLVGRKIVVHGGWDGRSTCMADLWVFNTDSFTWIQPRCDGIAPRPRYGHVLQLVADGRILCFGGTSNSAKDPVPQYHDDLRQLDTETMVWTKPSVAGVCGPSPRYGCAAAHLDGAIAFFGGWGKGGNQDHTSKQPGAGAFFALTTAPVPDTSLTWLKPDQAGGDQIQGNLIPNKYGHTITAVGNTLFVFGGWTGKQAVNDLLAINLR